MNDISVGHLYNFIMAHKSNKVFTEYTPEQIVTLIYNGIRDKTLYYSLDTNGSIDGMILAEIHIPSKKLFVMENLAMTLTNLRKFAQKAKEQFPGFRIEGYKHGKYHTYNQFVNRLTQ